MTTNASNNRSAHDSAKSTASNASRTRTKSLRNLAVVLVVCALAIPGTAFAMQNRGGAAGQAAPCIQRGVCAAAQGFYGQGRLLQGAGFVDADGDGICDNRGTNAQGAGFVDADGDGICDNRGTNAQGAGFVDADGDGICDNRGTNAQGSAYVDENENGVCDNRENGIRNGNAGQGQGQGQGQGWMKGRGQHNGYGRNA